MVTAATLRKERLFADAAKLTLLERALLSLAKQYQWQLEAWAVFPNHYHFVARNSESASLKTFLKHLHADSARELNRLDYKTGRTVWFNFWDTKLTYERSYLARLKQQREQERTQRLAGAQAKGERVAQPAKAAEAPRPVKPSAEREQRKAQRKPAGQVQGERVGQPAKAAEAPRPVKPEAPGKAATAPQQPKAQGQGAKKQEDKAAGPTAGGKGKGKHP